MPREPKPPVRLDLLASLSPRNPPADLPTWEAGCRRGVDDLLRLRQPQGYWKKTKVSSRGRMLPHTNNEDSTVVAFEAVGDLLPPLARWETLEWLAAKVADSAWTTLTPLQQAWTRPKLLRVLREARPDGATEGVATFLKDVREGGAFPDTQHWSDTAVPGEVMAAARVLASPKDLPAIRDACRRRWDALWLAKPWTGTRYAGWLDAVDSPLSASRTLYPVARWLLHGAPENEKPAWVRLLLKRLDVLVHSETRWDLETHGRIGVALHALLFHDPSLVGRDVVQRALTDLALDLENHEDPWACGLSTLALREALRAVSPQRFGYDLVALLRQDRPTVAVEVADGKVPPGVRIVHALACLQWHTDGRDEDHFRQCDFWKPDKITSLVPNLLNETKRGGAWARREGRKLVITPAGQGELNHVARRLRNNNALDHLHEDVRTRVEALLREPASESRNPGGRKTDKRA